MKKIFFLSLASILIVSCEDNLPTGPESVNPTVTAIEAPPEIYQIPASPTGIRVQVEDPQGLDDIASVTLSLASGSFAKSFELRDDGMNGDILKGDGQYFLPFDASIVDNETGEFVVRASAADLSGNSSNMLEDTLLVLAGNENRLPVILAASIPVVLWSDSAYVAQFTATGFDADGISTIRAIVLEVYPPAFNNPALIDTLRDDGDSGDGAAGDGEFGLRFDPMQLGSNCGIYNVVLRPIDNSNGIGKAIVRKLTVTQTKIANNSPPEVFNLIAPVRISRTASPNTYPLSISASDPDFVCNDRIVEVFFNSFRPDGTPASGNPFSMRDDGMGGDQVAGDSRYTLIIQIEASNPTGIFRFEFQALDRSGALSQKLIHTITVTE